MQISKRLMAFVMVLSPWAQLAQACPFCNSVTAARVREGIFGEDFGYHLTAAISPFPIFIGIVICLYFGPSVGKFTLSAGSPSVTHPSLSTTRKGQL